MSFIPEQDVPGQQLGTAAWDRKSGTPFPARARLFGASSQTAQRPNTMNTKEVGTMIAPVKRESSLVGGGIR